MTHTATTARDAVFARLRTAWLADPTTAPIAIHWDDVPVDPVDEDVTEPGDPEPFARVTLRTLTSGAETLGGVDQAKYQTEALLNVQFFEPYGEGHELADVVVEVIKNALRGKQDGSLWYFDVRVNEIGIDGAHFRTDTLAGVRYEERNG